MSQIEGLAPSLPAEPVPVAEADPAANKKRLAGLDQFRGYTMAGMFLVNFIGGYAAVHPVLGHHHTYCSYADTIMPQFFFAAGFAFRLTYLRRAREVGTAGAIGHAIKRNVKLILIGALFYNLLDIWPLIKMFASGSEEALPRLWHMIHIDSFQALVSIGVACLWVLPVMGRSTRVVWGYLFFSAALYTTMLATFYYDFAHNHVTDGGPLGFIGWSIPTLAGALVCDAVRHNREPMAQWKNMWWWAALLMLAGYGMACLNLANAPDDGVHTGISAYLVEPPFVPPTRPVDMWTMDQQTASTSYMVFSAGFSIAVYLLFVFICDGIGWTVGVFRTLGKNPLFGYVYEDVVGAPLEWAFKMDHGTTPLSMVLFVFALFFSIIWATLRVMEHKNWYWKM